MADDEADEEDEGPVVELGEGADVAGAPLARISSRFHYGIEKSEVVRREGDAAIRTPDGPRKLGDVLAASDESYFPTRQDLVAAVREVIGHGPVPTDEE
jgi:Trk K+ transport system NAD-binding subunit